jgi:cytochrome oxidase Cu insertion factor (SCO1/SenC/PrrC family)
LLLLLLLFGYVHCWGCCRWLGNNLLSSLPPEMTKLTALRQL